MCIYIYIYTHRTNTIKAPLPPKMGGKFVGLEAPSVDVGGESVTDGVGTPDPSPTHLVNRCF